MTREKIQHFICDCAQGFILPVGTKCRRCGKNSSHDPMICSVCGKEGFARELCVKHYQKRYRLIHNATCV